MDLYSLQYFVFLCIVVCAYYLAPQRFRWAVLLVASYFFYGSFKTLYVLLLVFSTITAYLAALLIEKRRDPTGKRIILLAGCVCNLGLLFLFKYYNFFSRSITRLLAIQPVVHTNFLLHLVVPVGISFYVFQIVSYIADVYHGKQKAEGHIGKFALYVAFFPKLLAGPIERAQQFLPQLRHHSSWDWERVTNGFKLMVWGLFKKVVVADRLGVYVDAVYTNPAAWEGPNLALSIVLYSFQIYYDFSGYTDIAIGISQVFGLRLAENFNRPYTARSVAEFWRRWHISFSTWLRDYLYIPLGGNRVVPARLYINLMIVFLICGLWHGANWTFVEWGMIHGLYLVIGLATKETRSKMVSFIGLTRLPRLHRGLQTVTTFILISLAWVFFRADSLYDAVYVVSHLHTGWGALFDGEALTQIVFFGKPRAQLVIALASLAFVWLIHALEDHENMRHLFRAKPYLLRWTVYYILLLSVLLLSAPSAQRFIYFQF